MPLFEWLENIDKFLFTLIQHDSDNAVLDVVMPVLRDPYTWAPFYAFMLYYAIRKGQQHAWVFIGLSLLTFAITDSLTAQIMKPMFGRWRPCHEQDLAQTIRGLVDCGGLFSMPSSHAANHFGLATFWYYAIIHMRTGGSPAVTERSEGYDRGGAWRSSSDEGLQKKPRGKNWWGALYWWAAAVCYAQIYVGKHYPFDVVAGACTGVLAGYGISRIFAYVWDRRSHRNMNFITH